MTDRSRRPSDRQIISRALVLLRAGYLASALAGLLMDEFDINATQARELAGRAIERWKKDTKQRPELVEGSLDEPGRTA